jgi:hypothetical protein
MTKPLNEAVTVGRQRMRPDDGSSVRMEVYGGVKRGKREGEESMRSGVASYSVVFKSR